MEENSLDSSPEEVVDVPETESPEIILSDKGRKFLNQTRPWVRFMSVMIFIGAGFMALGGVMTSIVGLNPGTSVPVETTGNPLLGNFVYWGLFCLFMAVLYVFPGIHLSRLASAIKTLESGRAGTDLEKVLKYQRSFWRYVGILTAFSLILLVSIFAFSIAVTIFMYMNS